MVPHTCALCYPEPMRELALTLLLALLGGCGSVCTSPATRCAGSVLELCSPSGHWRRVADCSEVRGLDATWECLEVDGEHDCVPEGQL